MTIWSIVNASGMIAGLERPVTPLPPNPYRFMT